MTTGLPDTLKTQWVGRRGRLFRLAMLTGFWTLLTLGFYRFWAKTRLRRWYWSAIRPGGQPVEYTGEGAEKLAGFFLAVSILAFWLGVVNLILMFASLSIWAVPGAAYALSTIGLVPIWFFARYRARTYVLARTRWRGIRFGMAPGAWGYAMRAVMHWLLTIVSLGILWPRMTFSLEKYKTDRTLFGTHRLEQGGHWTMLWPAFAPIFAIVLLMFLAGALAYLNPRGPLWALIGLAALLPFAMIYYRVSAQRWMAAEKRAGPMRFALDIRPLVIIRIVFFGGLAMVILLLLPLVLLGAAANALAALSGGLSDLTGLSVAGWAALVAVFLFYFLFFLLWQGLQHAFVTMPIWRHYADGLRLEGAGALAQVGQRDRAAAAEAEGFAEALDLGAAI